MAYVPVEVNEQNLADKIFQNIHRLVDEYKLSSTSITTQDSLVDAVFPIYVIYIPDITKIRTDFKSNNRKKSFMVQIDFDVKAESGWRQTALMADALDYGLQQETDNLKIANLCFIGSKTLANEPIDVNGQLVYSRSEEYEFEVLF